MLNESEVAAMQGWLLAAQRWSEASQELVGAGAGLALVSRTLADQIQADVAAVPEATRQDRAILADELGQLAARIEDETRSMRDGYLDTATRINTYKDRLL